MAVSLVMMVMVAGGFSEGEDCVGVCNLIPGSLYHQLPKSLDLDSDISKLF